MDDTYRSQFRLPYPLYEKLKKSAEEHNRSLNSELVYRLETSLSAPASTGSSWKKILEIENALEELKSQLMYIQGFEE